MSSDANTIAPVADESRRRVADWLRSGQAASIEDERALILSRDLTILRKSGGGGSDLLQAGDLDKARMLLCAAIRRSETSALGQLVRSRGDLDDASLEILLCLLLSRTGMLAQRIRDGEDLLRCLAFDDERAFAVIKALCPGAELFTKGFLYMENICDLFDPKEPFVMSDEVFVAVFGDGSGDHVEAGFSSQEEALEIMPQFFERYRRQFQRFSATQGHDQRWGLEHRTKRWASRLRISDGLPLAEILSWSSDGLQIILVCLCRELGMTEVNDEMFTGRGIITATYSSAMIEAKLDGFVECSRRLIAAEVIRPVGGEADMAEGTHQERLAWSYEITPAYLSRLKIEQKRCGAQRMRRPRLGLNDLVLSDGLNKRLQEAIDQCRHRDLIFKTWGLQETIVYGTGTTMLFSGPPGVGKTACAEALAHELDCPLMAINYGDILNCFVGNTEKNITAAFRDAQELGALLFWDEADSMFADRESASQRWQVGHTNLLLQEIERFEGCCILSTNRTPCLDQALARRIGLHLEFAPPNQDQRRRIWQKLMPERLPLAGEIAWDEIASIELTGGLIKNALIGAARRAAGRGSGACIHQGDLLAAAQEQAASRRNEPNGVVGFEFG